MLIPEGSLENYCPECRERAKIINSKDFEKRPSEDLVCGSCDFGFSYAIERRLVIDGQQLGDEVILSKRSRKKQFAPLFKNTLAGWKEYFLSLLSYFARRESAIF